MLSLMLFGVVVLLLVVAFAQYRWRNRHILAVASKLRCPPSLPIIGNALYFIGDITSITKNITKFTTHFKGLFCFWIGPVPVFVVSNPSDVQVVLNSSNTLEKDDIYNLLKPWLGNGLLTAPVTHWKKQRRLLNPLFHPSNVSKYIGEFNNISRELMSSLPKHGGSLDPRGLVFNAAMEAVTRAVMSENPLTKKDYQIIQQLLSDVGQMFTLRLFKIWLHIDFFFNFQYRKELKEALEKIRHLSTIFYKKWDTYMEIVRDGGIVLEYPHGGERALNMIDIAQPVVLAGATDSRQEWLDEVATIIVGATDTVVAAVGFLLFTLALHHDIQDKVRAEILEVLGDSDDDVTVDEANRMTYLGQAITETMRLHGVFPVILRKVSKDIKLSEATLPEGSRLMVTLHAMGWDTDTFPEPHKFIPERFSPNAKEDVNKKRHQYAFLPFSAGPRNCPGKGYAMLLIKTLAAHVLRRYRLRTSVRMEDLEYDLKVVMISKTLLTIDFEPLQHDRKCESA